jgi:macrolide transport system ATP-binding/permease protein
MFASIKMLAARIRGWFSRRRVDEDFEQELRAHLEMLTQENMQRGMTRKDAVRAARVRLGGVTQLRETNREMWGLPVIEAFLQDVRYALRMLRKSPGFAAVAILTLALGIGANTAIFSVVQAVYLRTLPIEHPEQVVLVDWDHSAWPRGIIESGYGKSLSYPAFEELRAKNSTLSSVFGFAPLGYGGTNTNVVVDGDAALVDGAMVTGDFFSGLGIRPIVGRAIDEQDDGESKPRVAVLGYRYWTNRFGSDSRAVGTSITINNVSCTIVGIAPPSFHGVLPGRDFDVYVSLSDGNGLKPYGAELRKNLLHEEAWFWITVMGRLKPGVSAASAKADLSGIFRNLMTSTVLKGYALKFTPYISVSPAGKGMDRVRDAFADPITLLEYMAALILLMSCANLASLLMARALSRSGEMGIRMAIGASRARLVRQLLIENLTLACLGATLGLAFAEWGARTFVLLLLPDANLLALDVHLEWRVLLFTAALAIVTAILFGLGPSISATRRDVAASLKESSRSGEVRGVVAKMKCVLICAQIAISLVLLAGAGLFLRTANKLENENLGFNRQQVLLFAVDATQNGYDRRKMMDFYGELQTRLEAIPGVNSASLSGYSLISGWLNDVGVTADNEHPESGSVNSQTKRRGTHYGTTAPGDEPSSASETAYFNSVGTHFFTTMGIPFVLGRDFNEHDMNGPAKTAVVNQTFAQRYWPNQNPVGRRFSFGYAFNAADSIEVIGVVQNAKFANVRETIRSTAYIPFTQGRSQSTTMRFEVKTPADASLFVPLIRNAVHKIDPLIPIFDVKTQTQQIDESLLQEHMFARLSTSFGLLALLVASVGLYGLLAYTVGQRTHEFGIRMALGASRGNILSIVLTGGLWLSGAGLVAGLGCALAFSRLLRKFLYGVQPDDLWTFVASALILIVVALLACWIPARRATRVDPMIALRYE